MLTQAKIIFAIVVCSLFTFALVAQEWYRVFREEIRNNRVLNLEAMARNLEVESDARRVSTRVRRLVMIKRHV